MTRVTLYHSAICPRCHMAKRSVGQLSPEFPNIEIEPVEFLTHRDRARADGIGAIPALVCGERKLSGFYLTKKRIRRFLESIQ